MIRGVGTKILNGLLKLAFLLVLVRGRRRLPPALILACGFVVTVAVSGSAVADWRYCLTLSDDGRRVLLSEPFESSAPSDGVERQFELLLRDAGLSPGIIQCPRAETQRVVREMRTYAREYNEGIGRDSIDLGWNPAARWAKRDLD